MKRGEPLKRTPFKPREKPMNRSGASLTARTVPERTCKPLKRTRIKPVSDKRKAENAIRARLTAAKRAEQDWCSACGRPADPYSLHYHELKSAGQGGSRIDLDNLLWVCDWCNGRFEDDPDQAVRDGFKFRDKPLPEDYG